MSPDTVPVNVIGCSAWMDPIVIVSPSSAMSTCPFETHEVSWMSIVPLKPFGVASIVQENVPLT